MLKENVEQGGLFKQGHRKQQVGFGGLKAWVNEGDRKLLEGGPIDKGWNVRGKLVFEERARVFGLGEGVFEKLVVGLMRGFRVHGAHAMILLNRA
jgi:hypothetical protein